MTHRKRRRGGSALVMVVGLLAMIFMLGTTFLLVSQLDARQSKALAQHAPVPGLAEGLVAEIVAALRDDRYIGSGGPYSDTGDLTGAARWLAYVDAPLEEADPHLARLDLLMDMRQFPMQEKRRLSNLDNYEAQEDLDRYVLVTTFGRADKRLVDTDGDEEQDNPGWDGLLRWAGVTDPQGMEFHVAARITDQAGRICVNTAGEYDANGIDNVATPIHPPSVDLRGFFIDAGYGQAYYDRLHAARCGGNNPDIAKFDAELATRLLNPARRYYTPFTGADEAFLRWLGPGATTNRGPLYEAVPSLSAGARQLLTTYSASNTLLRHPDLGNDFRTRTYLDVTSPAGRAAVYKRMFTMLDRLGIGAGATARKRMAACFTANLWAYQSIDDRNSPWAFAPSDLAGFTAYGLIQDLVITEAYAAHKPDSDPANNTNDHVWGCAVELMNPTGSAITLNPNSYVLKVGAAPKALPTVTVPANGGKVVLYYWEKGGGAAPPVDQTSVGFPANIPDAWKVVDGLTFLNDATVRLFRKVGPAGVLVPVDQVGAGDLGYNVADPAAEPEQTADIRRDDDLDRARYNVAAYVDFSSTGHALGSANGLAGEDLAAEALFPVPIIRRGAPIASIGECMRIYLTGPTQDGSDLKAFPINVMTTAESALFGNVRARGRLDLHPADIAYDGYSPGDYPDVPAAALLGEFFTLLTADAWRGDETPSRVYGLVNINTAPAEVLQRLPWPKTFTVNGTTYDVDPAVVAEYIVAYRDRRWAMGGPRYTDRAKAAGVANLRTTGGDPSPADAMCFLTPGEIAVPLADYANRLMGWTNYGKAPETDATVRAILQSKDYLDARDSLYRAVANLVTVRSDVYAVNIRVHLGQPDQPERVWYYVAVIDRGNCRKPEDLPAVLLLARVK